jgi:diacylglycerol kinase (ATP)
MDLPHSAGLTSALDFRILPSRSVKLTILCNPTAGGGKTRRALDAALEILRRGRVEPRVLESSSAQHLMELARQARADQPDAVVSVGGDGTIHHVLNGLFPGEVPLGIIPVGRGNDLARGLGVPSDPRLAAEILLKGKVRQIDLARARNADHSASHEGGGSTLYACIAGVGFDSVVTRYANDHAPRIHGRFAYIWGILRCLWSYRPQPLDLTTDEQNFSGNLMFAVVGNNPTYGDGVKMVPRARLDDGLLDVCIVPAMGKVELLRWVRRAYRGKHIEHPRIVYFQTRRVTLRSAACLELFGDGEFLQELPATIDVIPNALRVIVPG